MEYAARKKRAYGGVSSGPIGFRASPSGSGIVASTLEIELKLTGRPDDLAAVFASLKGRKSKPFRLLSAYFDTPDGRLWSRGFTLRLREKKSGHELTLKREDGRALARGEWTARVEEPRADIALLPAEAPRCDIGVILPEELGRRFSSEIERRQTVFKDHGTMIEASLDIGRIVAADREAPMAELEFELLSGSALVMLEYIQALVQRRPVSISTRSKAARGRDLAMDAPPASMKAAKPDLNASDSIEHTVREVISTTVTQILGNLDCATDGRDPEGVHQLRVALRRLRTAFSIFKDQLAQQVAVLDSDARHALKLLGETRDLDVFLTETMPPVQDGNAGMAGLTRLAEIAGARRRQAYGEVRRLVADRRFNVFLLELLRLAEWGGAAVNDPAAPLGPTAVRLLRKRHGKVLKIGRNFETLSYAQRHEVRIALKKLRYACDYFQVLYPRKACAGYLKRLSTLQDDLGRLNDAAVAERMAEELAAGNAEAALGATLVRGWYGHRLRATEPRMIEAWRAFTKARPFWPQENTRG